MAYGTTNVDTIQSSTANTPVVFKDGNGTQIGTLCRAWVNFNGTGTVAIRASFNVSSITDNGTGSYTVNFTTAMPDVNYSVTGACGDTANVTPAGSLYPLTYATGSVRVASYTNSAGSLFDCGSVNVAIFR